MFFTFCFYNNFQYNGGFNNLSFFLNHNSNFGFIIFIFLSSIELFFTFIFLLDPSNFLLFILSLLSLKVLAFLFNLYFIGIYF